jgi:5-methylthioadenosine/S-adenosylhomocysteine deaminase
MRLIIRQVEHAGASVDVLIRNGVFERIAPTLDERADTELDGRGKAMLPPLINGHTHAAMTLLRGYADDLDLHTWLNDHIWPLEAGMTEETVYHGARLACLEMIKSGTVFFNDMYWHFRGTARAVQEAGLKAMLSGVLIDGMDETRGAAAHEANRALYAELVRNPIPRIRFALGPHALYTVSEKSLQQTFEFAAAQQLPVHLHLSETRQEVTECLQRTGLRPVQWLAEKQLLGPTLIAAHAVWLDDSEIRLLADHKVSVIHNPASHMKLASGVCPFVRLKQHGVRIGLGTDGCASNNNLDLLEEARLAALLAKSSTGDPACCTAEEVFHAATREGAQIFGLSGEIREGAAADAMLIDLNHHRLVPGYHLVSDLIYSAGSDCIDTVLCDGRVLMENRQVPGEEDIKAAARECARRLVAAK